MKDTDDMTRKKFRDPFYTLDGSQRASVPFERMKTLWFNTGTLCNIECANCYIKSSPTNDDLIYLTQDDVAHYLAEMDSLHIRAEEIGFTGGEPFMNPEMISITEQCLVAGYPVLVLTNAMRPMMRPSVKTGLLKLNETYPGQLTLRISLDHFDRDIHDRERGKGNYDLTLDGMRWLSTHKFQMHVAGRADFAENEASAREGYAALFAQEGFCVDAFDPKQTVVFPEMDEARDVPEITTACWDILQTSPNALMCSHSRMVVKRKGREKASVVACTLLPYEAEFELGPTLDEARKSVSLNHPHCAKFCVLGKGSCSA